MLRPQPQSVGVADNFALRIGRVAVRGRRFFFGGLVEVMLYLAAGRSESTKR